MELSTKEVGGIAGWCISLGSVIAWVKIKIKDHGEGLAKHDVRLKKIEEDNSRLAKIEDHDIRLKKVESRFFTENNEPALLSYRAHKHICDQKSEAMSLQLQHVVEALNNHSRAVKDNSEQVAQLSILVAVLEEKVVRP